MFCALIFRWWRTGLRNAICKIASLSWEHPYFLNTPAANVPRAVILMPEFFQCKPTVRVIIWFMASHSSGSNMMFTASLIGSSEWGGLGFICIEQTGTVPPALVRRFLPGVNICRTA